MEQRTMLRWRTHRTSVEAVWGWGVVSSDFLGKSWESPGKILRFLRIIRRCTNHDPRKNGIYVT
jgi:hypothetical protein